MKIGIFDSGLGGLIITHSLTQSLPEYDYLYIGDTARVPYGNRSQQIIYKFTQQAVDYLFEQGCGLIIIACNTASAEALRQLQQKYLPERWPGKHILGVLIPAAEEAIAATKTGRIGVLATSSTIASGAFDRELKKLRPDAEVVSNPAPLLVPLIENDGLKWSRQILKEYLAPLTDIDTLILGCTHYPYLKDSIRELAGETVTVISQDELLPAKLRDYFKRHPELENRLSANGRREFRVTDITDQAVRQAAQLYGHDIDLQLVSLGED